MVGEMSSLLRELEQVQDRLTSSTNDTQAEKLDLLKRQEELRTRAAQLAVAVDSQGSTQSLLVQLADLRRQLSALQRQRRSASPTAGAERQSSPNPSFSRIETRIARIERILMERGIRLR